MVTQQRRTFGRRRAVVAAVAGVALGGVAVGFEATAQPFTWQADLTTALVGLAVASAGAVHLRKLAAPAGQLLAARASRTAIAVWIVVATATLSYELTEFFSSPRSRHPTISSLLNAVEGHEVLRGALFVLWIAAGWWIWQR